MAVGPLTFGQSALNAGQGLPQDPHAVFAAAAPFYDFSSPTLKPWHLKAIYHLYDEKGNPGAQGTYEHWWASPTVYRDSWTRAGAVHTDWYTADGKHAFIAEGGPLEIFEYKLRSALLSPLPSAADLDPAKVRLDRGSFGPKDAKLPCIMVVPLMPQHGQVQVVPLGLFPTYCFDPQLPVLRTSSSFGALNMGFENVVKVQGKYLAREVLLFEGDHKLLSATVDSITYLNPSDPALTPSQDAKLTSAHSVQIAGGVAAGSLLKMVVPVYPQDAKHARVSGTVVLEATIGMDGGVHDLQVVSAPWPSLAASALWAVSHWQYKPYLVNGEPVDVETTINVVYTLRP